MVVIIVPQVGMVELVIGVMLLMPVGLRGSTEEGVAMTGVAISLVSILWFGMWSVSTDALYGVYLSLASSIGLCAGCLAWLHELDVRPPVDMPRAIAVDRDG